ncbi:hypothetical protein Drorol1_Dr00025097 [Drosera rotundifolia]
MATTLSPLISPPLTRRTTLLRLKSSPPPASMSITAKSALCSTPRQSLEQPGRMMVAEVVGAYNKLTNRMISSNSESSSWILFQGSEGQGVSRGKRGAEKVKAADLTNSPVHRVTVGIVDASTSVSLWFPRLVRIHDDKLPEQATSPEQIPDMFFAKKNNHRGNQDDEEDD